MQLTYASGRDAIGMADMQPLEVMHKEQRNLLCCVVTR